MSSSSSGVPLSLATKEGAFQLRLFDHANNRIATGSGKLEQKVQPGLYRLVIDGGPVVDERFLAVGTSGFTDHQLSLDVPSAAPVKGASTTHEYHAEPALQLSHNPMRQIGSGGRLVVFVRSMSGTQREPVDVSGLSLWNAQNEPLMSGPQEFKSDPSFGWAGFSADVDPGGYLLRQELSHQDKGSVRTIDQSLWVEPGWTTLLFVPFKQEVARPQPEFGSIYIVRMGDGFVPYDDGTNLALEVALSGLRKGRALVPDGLLPRLLGGKFSNPMLGIVGALALLQSRETDWKLFDEVRRNLVKLVPNVPDVHALHVMGKGARGVQTNSQIPSIGWPPMLRACYTALIERDAVETRHIVAEDSVADLAAARLLASGPWTQWRRIEGAESAPGLAKESVRFSKAGNVGLNLWNTFAKVKVAAGSAIAASSIGRPSSGAIGASSAGFSRSSGAAQKPTAMPEAVRIADYIGAMSSLENAPSENEAESIFDVRAISQGTGLPRSAVARGLQTLSSFAGKGDSDGGEIA